MSSKNSEILKQVCCDVFEQLAFMFGEELDPDEIESDSETFIRASMKYIGDIQGTIEIIVPNELAESLAYNILGIDEDDELEEGGSEDALKELLNTITGKLITAAYGEEKVFDLSIPETNDISNEEWESLLEENDYIAIDIEDNPVLLYTSP